VLVTVCDVLCRYVPAYRTLYVIPVLRHPGGPNKEALMAMVMTIFAGMSGTLSAKPPQRKPCQASTGIFRPAITASGVAGPSPEVEGLEWFVQAHSEPIRATSAAYADALIGSPRPLDGGTA
jgi:hypothetical protein